MFRHGYHEAHITALARLCVFCLLSTFRPRTYFKENIKRKRTSSQSESDAELLNGANKIRKVIMEGTENTCMNEYQIEDADTKSYNTFQNQTNIINSKTLDVCCNPVVPISESLKLSLNQFFNCLSCLQKAELSQQMSFAYKFIYMLVDHGGDQGRQILKILPVNIIKALGELSSPYRSNVALIVR